LGLASAAYGAQALKDAEIGPEGKDLRWFLARDSGFDEHEQLGD
jgi:hypothetical protein